MERFDENVVDIRRQQKEEASKATEVTLIIIPQLWRDGIEQHRSHVFCVTKRLILVDDRT